MYHKPKKIESTFDIIHVPDVLLTEKIMYDWILTDTKKQNLLLKQQMINLKRYLEILENALIGFLAKAEMTDTTAVSDTQ